MKKKTYVLTVSKTFMKEHPRAGDFTGFKEQILNGVKIHTIRSGDHWRNVVDQVNSGRAFLSVREWTGKPYASKQIEVIQFEKLGWQDFEMDINAVISIDKFYTDVDYDLIAANDGLSLIDFYDWFKAGKKEFSGGIIHFTDFRY